MNILGLSDWRGSHDSSAAIVRDGGLVAAAEEERFSRKKHDGAPPWRAVESCLRQAAIDFREIDYIAFAGLPFRTGRNSFLAELDREFVQETVRRGTFRRRTALHKLMLDAYLALGGPPMSAGIDTVVGSGLQELEQRFGELPQLRYFGHHASHAASALLARASEASTVVTIDGVGDFYSTVAWKSEADSLSRIRAEPATNSLGQFYYDCTNHLGLGEFGEGKTMGLAAYGDPRALEDVAARLLDISGPGWYRYDGPVTRENSGFTTPGSDGVFAEPFTHFAAACQGRLEAAVARVTDLAAQAAGRNELCLGGGVTMNCSANGALLASGRFDSISVFPASGDAGLSTGAAMLCSGGLGVRAHPWTRTAYLGPAFDDRECLRALEAEPRVTFSKPGDIVRDAADLLAAGNVLGWFQGRMELGPRALGNRSILADPRSVAIRDRVNRLKGREPWRPLAPSVPAEAAGEYFALPAESPYMLFAAQVKAAKRSAIAGVVHADGSARPQTVRAEHNPRFHQLLRAFERRTGVPVLLNTSFNAAGEAIVCAPEDAIRTLLAIGLDALVLGDYLVRPAAPPAQASAPCPT